MATSELLSAAALRWFDQAGVFVFALSGASLAARKRFDIVGVAVLAGATGLGGGIVRDVLLGDTPPLAFRSRCQHAAAAPAASTAGMAYSSLSGRKMTGCSTRSSPRPSSAPPSSSACWPCATPGPPRRHAASPCSA